MSAEKWSWPLRISTSDTQGSWLTIVIERCEEPSAAGKEPSAAGKEPSAVGKEPSAGSKEPSVVDSMLLVLEKGQVATAAVKLRAL